MSRRAIIISQRDGTEKKTYRPKDVEIGDIVYITKTYHERVDEKDNFVSVDDQIQFLVNYSNIDWIRSFGQKEYPRNEHVKDFVFYMKENLDAFEKNLERHRYTHKQWMEIFLRWMEWETDMHEAYWGDE